MAGNRITIVINADGTAAIEGMNRVTGGMKKMEGETKGITSKLKSNWLAVTAAVTTTAYAINKITQSFIEAASVSEQYNVRLKVLLGSTEEGGKLFQSMAEYAGKVPFEFEKIMGSATQLAGIMGGGVKEIEKWMPLIGDLAAASGLGIEKTTEQVIRMYSAGAASADMFRERGVLAMLGFQAGVSYSAEETRKKLIEAWESPLSKFRGATAELAQTWEGQLSMMSDKWFRFRNIVANSGAFDQLKSSLGEINEKLETWLNTNEKLIQQKIWEYIDKTKTAIHNLITVYNTLPDGVIGAAGTGIIVRILTGSTPIAKVVALFLFLNTQLEKLGIGISSTIKKYNEAVESIENLMHAFNELTSKTPWEGSVGYFGLAPETPKPPPGAGAPPGSEPPPGAKGAASGKDEIIYQRNPFEWLEIYQEESLAKQTEYYEKQFQIKREGLLKQYNLEQEMIWATQGEHLQNKKKLQAIEADHQSAILSMQQQAAQGTIGLAVAVAGAFGASQQAMFLLAKAGQVAMAIVNAHAAAAAALAPPPLGLGPVLGAPLAAKMLTWGYINAAIIAATGIAQAAGSARGSVPKASTSIGGFSGGSSGGGFSGGTDNRRPRQSINVNVYGNIVDHDQFARELIKSIKKAEKDGA